MVKVKVTKDEQRKLIVKILIFLKKESRFQCPSRSEIRCSTTKGHLHAFEQLKNGSEHLSLKVPNLQFEFDVSAQALTLNAVVSKI